MSALIAAMWPSIEGSVSKLMREYPPALKTAFGIDELDSLAAYVSAEMLSLIVPLALVVPGRAVRRRRDCRGRGARLPRRRC